MTLPPELLTKVSKYNSYDYKTLYSCILVNKQWHSINIPILWENPFCSKGSTKIIINCLLEEDKDFLTRNGIELTFELLDKSPLYNYARFCTKFHLNRSSLQLLSNASKPDILQDRLINFTLDHLAVIRCFNNSSIGSYLVNNCHRFGSSFQYLNEFVCYSSKYNPVSNEFIDKLANICKCIQSLEIYGTYNNKLDDSLIQLIKAQNQIKQLAICLNINHALSDNFIKAILAHSQSITHYSSNGRNNIDHILLPSLKNLKFLRLRLRNTSSYFGDELKWLKNILQPNIEFMILHIRGQEFLSDLSDFINNNGKTLRYLSVYGGENDSKFLGKLFQSIAQQCKNLVNLSIFYNDKVNQELTGIFNNCIKLESITFYNYAEYYFSKGSLDGDKILSILSQTLPKKLTLIVFSCEFSTINVNSFDNIMKNWKGPKPFTIKFNDYQRSMD